jgi:hypothetical protein
MTAHRQRSLLAARALWLLGPRACVAGAPERPAGVPEPPTPLPEFRSAPPTPTMVWIPGAWHWDGVTYVWIPGHWASPPPVPDGS